MLLSQEKENALHPTEQRDDTMKSLDQKLARIRAGNYTPADFIIADAKDPDMAFGIACPGPARDASGRLLGGLATRPAFLQTMRDMTNSGLVDIMLTSVSTAQILQGERLFDNSPVTPAVRYNDTTDIWYQRGATYGQEPSQPFRTARLGKLNGIADLGLYSMTFSNNVDGDLRTLNAYSQFREEASALGLRHFLEVFNPAFDVGISSAKIGTYIGDSIVRALAGVVAEEQPVFLKIVYNGRRATEELAQYDPSRLVVGVLGGGKGTTRDTFELLHRAEVAGARVALFGRKINYAERPLALVALMRRVVARELTPEEAVVAYHDDLAANDCPPTLSLVDDMKITEPTLLADD